MNEGRPLPLWNVFTFRSIPIAIVLGSIVWMLSASSSAQDKPTATPERVGPATTGDGLIRNEPQAFQGYTLLSPLQSKSTYLIDMQGHVVKTWKTEYTPASLGYLLKNGDLLRPAESPRPVFGAGGGTGGRIQRFNWDGQLVWDYIVSNDQIVAHHDVAPMPSGNVMILIKERISDQQAIAAGRVPASVLGSQIFADALIEVRPTGLNTGEVVWKWRLWDHLIQEYDPSKANYGVVAEHPERVDLNYDEGIVGARLGDSVNATAVPRPATLPQNDQTPPAGIAPGRGPGAFPGRGPFGPRGGPRGGRGGRGGTSNPDWTHTNAIAYNAELDQLMLSIHEFSEVWIIDHSTTTEESAGGSGGRHGKGGDLLYRWGNPIVYRAGTEADRRLFMQHDAHWIDPGLPGAGNMLVFNNGNGRPGGTHSSVDEVVLPVDKNGNYTRGSDGRYGPGEAVWSYAAPNPPDFYSNFISGAQRMPSGNTVICSGANGIMFEVTPDKQVVWNYMNPWRDERSGPGPARGRGNRGGGPPGAGGPSGRSIFRIYRFAPDYPALAGKDLTPGPTLVEITDAYYAKPAEAGEKAP